MTDHTLNAIIVSIEVFADIQSTHITIGVKYARDATQRIGPLPLTIELLRNLILVFGVRELSKATNRPIRVKRAMREQFGNPYEAVISIGHFLNDEWISLECPDVPPELSRDDNDIPL